jgi:hypothetical protein
MVFCVSITALHAFGMLLWWFLRHLASSLFATFASILFASLSASFFPRLRFVSA